MDANTETRAQGPLSGIKVLEVAQWWFVPATAAILSDWGAEVIKIEHPVTGDAMRGLSAMGWKSKEGNIDFMMQQSGRGKRSIGIDIGEAGGLELLLKMVEEADVFLTNFLPDARERLGIDIEDIRKRNPNIIYVRGTGHGPEGPDKNKGGYDATSFWSRGGVAEGLRPANVETPVMQRPAFGDSIGALTLAGGVTAALLQRERTGVAPVVDVSLLNTAMWVMAPDIVASKLADQTTWMPAYNRKAHFSPLTNTYLTKDNRWLMLMVMQAELHWADFCEHIERIDLIDDPRFENDEKRHANREALIADLDTVFSSRTMEEWHQQFSTLKAAWAPMQSAGDIYCDPQVQANHYLSEVETGNGDSFTLVSSPVQFDGKVPTLNKSPDMGQHTEEILLEMGFTWDEITAHKTAGIIN